MKPLLQKFRGDVPVDQHPTVLNRPQTSTGNKEIAYVTQRYFRSTSEPHPLMHSTKQLGALKFSNKSPAEGRYTLQNGAKLGSKSPAGEPVYRKR